MSNKAITAAKLQCAVVQLKERLNDIVQRTGGLDEALPLLFKLKGKPFSLEWSHFMFKPMYQLVNVPRLVTWRTGRQCSKCGVGSTKVVKRDGSTVCMSSLSVGDEVACVDESLRPTDSVVSGIFPNGPQPTKRLTLRLDGRPLEFTSNHRFLTDSGYKEVSDLKVGDRLARPVIAGRFARQSPVPEDKVKFIAYMLGDGGYTQYQAGFTTACGEVLSEILGIADRQSTKLCLRKTKGLAHQIRFSCLGELNGWLKISGLSGKYSYEKSLPSWVYSLDPRKTALFLSRLWATDGMIKPCRGGWVITYTSTSQLLAEGVQSLLRKFGILSGIRRRQAGYKKNGVYKRCRDAYTLRVLGRDSWLRFKDMIGPVPGKPYPTAPLAAFSSNNQLTAPPEVTRLIRELSDALPSEGSLHKFGLRRKPKYALSSEKLGKYVDVFSRYEATRSSPAFRKLTDLTNPAIVWDYVEAIEDSGVQEVYDIEVATYHNFIANGVVSHNSTNQSASQILRATIVPHYSILTVLPRYEQARVFSSNNAAPFINDSPIKAVIQSDGTESASVLQRDVGIGSKLYYGSSFGGADRLRGRSVDEVIYDEYQSLDPSELGVIDQCMSASRYKLSRYTGTPLTFDNQLEVSWQESSMGIWHIPCQETGCKHLNKCSADKSASGGDLLKMIGDSTLICAKCGRPVNSRLGYYIHDHPERMRAHQGFHVPQLILPMHYEKPKDWQVILDFRKNKPAHVFYNEVLGESYDVGAKMLTLEELKTAATVEPREPKNFEQGKYICSTLGVDWGGRGREKTSDTDDFISNTAFALAGMLPDGVIEINWLYKIPYTVDVSNEAGVAAQVAADAMAYWIALDYGGQGNVHESLLKARGWPSERTMPFTYSVMPPTKPIVFYNPPAARGVRSSYTLDKPRSLLLLAELIKRGQVRLPSGDKYFNDHLRDFLNVYEESIENPRGSPTRLVKRLARRTDDVVHAVNFAVMCMYHATSRWPQVAQAFISDQ